MPFHPQSRVLQLAYDLQTVKPRPVVIPVIPVFRLDDLFYVICGQFVNGNCFFTDIWSVLKFPIAWEPDIPNFHTIAFACNQHCLQGIVQNWMSSFSFVKSLVICRHSIVNHLMSWRLKSLKPTKIDKIRYPHDTAKHGKNDDKSFDAA